RSAQGVYVNQVRAAGSPCIQGATTRKPCAFHALLRSRCSAHRYAICTEGSASTMLHTLPVARIRGLVADDRGLDASAVADRRRQFGPNDIVESVRSPVMELARETARDPMIWFLVGTAVLYAVLSEYSEAITLLVSILPLVGMDAYLHRRTQASTQGLRGLLADTARVIRDGAQVEVPATDVVVGDLAIVATGEPFPADGLLVEGSELRVDESALTGEAYPVSKHPLRGEPLGGEEVPIDSEHCGFAGTRLLTGRARLRVTTVGKETLYGSIVQLATGAIHERTPLQRAVGGLVTALLASAAVLCALLAFVRLQEGYGWADAIVSAATLAVAALPEEFPVVLTVFLGVGVYRLARRKALVNRAVAVENIGRVSVICSDKTGTITEGRLRLVRVVPANGHDDAAVLRMAAAAARLETGDPLDRAIIEAAGDQTTTSPLATFPFTEDRRRETVVVRDDAGISAHTKGAPETVLAMCGERDRAAWSDRVGELASGGHKLIACASRRLAEYSGGEPDREFVLGGLIAIADPVRAEVPRAVEWCRTNGVRVIVLTGDHPNTARAVAIEMGLSKAPVVITGDELASAASVATAIRGIDVVARAMPAQKLAIVRALQQAGELVAVTGDGVNDVPALQAADVGIAMGQKGARSAREVSSIVLLDDNFGSIVAAIAEGRSLFTNLRRSFQYLLVVHIPLVLTATFIPLAGYPVLYLPIHIVWLEAIIHPTAMLAFQRTGADLAAVSSRTSEVRLFSRMQWTLILSVGLAVTAVVVLTYARSLAGGDEHARAMAMIVLVTASASTTAVLDRLRTRAAWVVIALSVAVTLALVQVPWLAAHLHLSPLHVDDWLLAIAGGVAVPLVLGIDRHRPARPTTPTFSPRGSAVHST
ncbi:MAG TPA: cation-transporting P-type ATPase, partial [Kofleriaceae bacterium]